MSLRLGDELDDYCIKCRRLSNHVIVSLMNGEAAKVRCRSCYGDHDYRREVVPPTKKELKKAAEDAAGNPPPPATPATKKSKKAGAESLPGV